MTFVAASSQSTQPKDSRDLIYSALSNPQLSHEKKREENLQIWFPVLKRHNPKSPWYSCTVRQLLVHASKVKKKKKLSLPFIIKDPNTNFRLLRESGFEAPQATQGKSSCITFRVVLSYTVWKKSSNLKNISRLFYFYTILRWRGEEVHR